MKFLVYGAGTIGTIYGFLLSQAHDVDLLVRPEQYDRISAGVRIAVKDLRKQQNDYAETVFCPRCVTGISDEYDAILVTVNRYQLKDVLPVLKENQEKTGYFVFMQNNWDLKTEIEAYLPENRYIIAFPSSVGGGRDDRKVEAIVFDEATRVGGECRPGIDGFTGALTRVGVSTSFDSDIFGWLKVHYLQQSITAGAVLESGDFEKFSHDYKAVRKMVKAFREGIEVCRVHGVNTKKTFPAYLFRFPVFIVAHTMQKMFLELNTVEMVNNHMKKGLPEWIAGYKEVLEDGLKCGLSMDVWKSYLPYIERYTAENH